MSDGDNPLAFSILQGQRKAKALLKRVIDSGRLAHAYLFRGPDGVGKRLCAELLAARLNCLQPGGDGACGTCVSCRKHLSGNHPDYVVIRPDGGAIKIDRVRELCRSLAFPPYESEYRVVVLEDIHIMRTEAANSLLKTLEEPPEKNVLILTAESSKSVLPTILSRCQVIPFYGLGLADTKHILGLKADDISVEEAELLSRLSGGSPGQALLLREEDILSVWETALAALTIDPAISEDSVTTVLQAAEKMADLKEHIVPLLGLLRIWVRDRMVEQVKIDSQETRQQLWQLQAIDRAERQLARNCNRTLVCEVLLFDLQSPTPRVPL